MLQSNLVLDKIKSGLTKKILTKLKALIKKSDASYDEFLSHYGKILKEGIHTDADNKEAIAEVVKFESLLTGNNLSLDAYLDNIPPSQPSPQGEEGAEPVAPKTIYYITGRNKSEALANPYLEQFRDKKIDVLIMTDPIDEWAVQSLTEYK